MLDSSWIRMRSGRATMTLPASLSVKQRSMSWPKVGSLSSNLPEASNASTLIKREAPVTAGTDLGEFSQELSWGRISFLKG